MPTEPSEPVTMRLSQHILETNPHPHLHQLRQNTPIAWVPFFNGWFVTRYDLATTIMRDAATFTVDHPGFSTARVIGQSMLSRDGAEHQRHRQPFDAPFRRQAIQSRFGKRTAEHAKRILLALYPQGKADLSAAFAAPLAVRLMIDALGLTAIPVQDILHWYGAIVDAVTQITLGRELSSTGKEAFAALTTALRPALQREPESSLLAAASAMAEGLSEAEVISNAAVLLFGGIETTEGMIANALYYLLINPEIMATVRAEPTVVPAVIEETLRLEPAAAVVDRYATVDIQLVDAQIRAGDLVRVSLSAANRDPTIFPDPDRFDPTRTNLRSHVAFAQGPHVCLGLHLARLEAVVAVTHCVRMLPKLQLRDDTASVTAAQPRGLVFRKPQALQVTW